MSFFLYLQTFLKVLDLIGNVLTGLKKNNVYLTGMLNISVDNTVAPGALLRFGPDVY